MAKRTFVIELAKVGTEAHDEEHAKELFWRILMEHGWGDSRWIRVKEVESLPSERTTVVMSGAMLADDTPN